jgi:hypothetical protein
MLKNLREGFHSDPSADGEESRSTGKGFTGFLAWLETTGWNSFSSVPGLAPKLVHRPKTTTPSGVFWAGYLPAPLYLSVSYRSLRMVLQLLRQGLSEALDQVASAKRRISHL